jgi:hypothetical protein
MPDLPHLKTTIGIVSSAAPPAQRKPPEPPPQAPSMVMHHPAPRPMDAMYPAPPPPPSLAARKAMHKQIVADLHATGFATAPQPEPNCPITWSWIVYGRSSALASIPAAALSPSSA